MHPSSVLIKQAIDQALTIDGSRPDEALAICRAAYEYLVPETDQEWVRTLRYRELFYVALLGYSEQGLTLSSQLIDAIKPGEDDLTLCKVYNIKGNVLVDMGMLDASLEAYVDSLQIAEQYQFHQMMAVVANNIGSLYSDLEDIVVAKAYFEKALVGIEAAYSIEQDQQLEVLKGTAILNLAQLSIKEGLLEEAKILAHQAEVMFRKSGNEQSLNHTFSMYMEIAYKQGHEDLGEDYYNRAKTYYHAIADHIDIITLNLESARYWLTQADSLSRVIDLLVEAESLCTETEYVKYRIEVYALLASCYDRLGQHDLAIHYYKAYHSAQSALDTSNKEQQLNLMRVRFEIEQSKQERLMVQKRNEELKQKSTQLLIKKERLEQAYQRIQLISQIGQKITSTLDLSEILMSVYDNLKHHMLIDSFYMVMLNDEKTHLCSITSVEHLHFDRAFAVSVDDENSLLAYSYREKRHLLIYDVYEDELIKGWSLIKRTDADIRSIICVPLMYDEDVIGVCSVQCIEPYTYTEDHLEIMEALSTYLAIAVNNAQKSKRLEQEVQMRLKTQKELERLNSELRSISEIDGLTKVPNRRRFESVYEQLFEVAMVQQQALHVMMIDIDFFKVYNDFYGHLKGDEVLIAVAQKLSKAFRYKNRLFARYGGEEFVAVLGEMTQEEAVILAHELRVAISNMAIDHEQSQTGFLTISIGIASAIPKTEEDMRRLLHHADECLYFCKNNGRNRVQSMWLS